jgi:zinc protease
MRTLRTVCWLLALSASLAAVTPPSVKFTDTKLKNGLRVIIVEDHTAPVFSIAITYNVGSRNERAGRTGFAHLFEHMMFKGSANVGSGEHFMLVYNNGGDMNGSTSKDRTNYFERLPANQLDLALFLESDRMRSLDITKENLQNQISTVKEERRQGVDNQPYGKTMEAFDDLAYENANYKHSVIGSMSACRLAMVSLMAG